MRSPSFLASKLARSALFAAMFRASSGARLRIVTAMISDKLGVMIRALTGIKALAFTMAGATPQASIAPRNPRLSMP